MKAEVVWICAEAGSGYVALSLKDLENPDQY